jgi:hypothetical protein
LYQPLSIARLKTFITKKYWWILAISMSSQQILSIYALEEMR